MKIKKFYIPLLIFLIAIILFSNIVISLSERAIITEEKIQEAKNAVLEMQEKEIPIKRANETLQEAIQIYSGQLLLEKAGKNPNYEIPIELCEKVLEIKKTASVAQDELKIFLETYSEYEKEINLDEMKKEYNNIIISFEEERFEDTVELIDSGYEKLSELQSSQTNLKLFYKSTSNTIKSFFEKYWLHLGIGLLIIFFIFFIFKKAITILITKRKIKNLEIKKQNLNELIKKVQKGYFGNKKVSHLEYEIKIKKFQEMIRDINRQIPLLKETLMRNKKQKK